MSGPAAERRWAWPVALAALAAGALALRLWGVRHGLPYVYNADENAHFVPRAIGFFGHDFDPGYFVNPPAFTYLLHVLFWVRWGGEGVQQTLAADPGAVFALARATAAVLGAGAVALLALAAARLLDRRTALVAAALFAVAFLPVHYGHFALNDVPAMAPLCLSLFGAAGVLRRARPADHLLAGAGLGLAAATKYTAAVALLAYLAAALGGSRRLLVLGAGAGLLAFVVANPYAVLDPEAFARDLVRQSSAASDGGGKLGLPEQHPVLYYAATLTWGLGWLPVAAAAAGAVVIARRDRRVALMLVAPPLACVLVLGVQDRFFSRWLLPAYPFLCVLAAVAALAAADAVLRGRRSAVAAVAAAALLGAQGLAASIHNDQVLSRDDTRALAREWMVRAIPAGTRIVVEPVTPDTWAMDAGRPSPATPNGYRWRKWPTSRSRVAPDGSLLPPPGRVVKLEDYERTTRPQLVSEYAAAGYCWVLTGSTQFGRVHADPEEVPDALRYYAALRRRGEVVHRVRPWAPGARPVPFSFDFSFNAYPRSYRRPGPEIVIYRLRDCGR